jgi:hypothetical protein
MKSRYVLVLIVAIMLMGSDAKASDYIDCGYCSANVQRYTHYFDNTQDCQEKTAPFISSQTSGEFGNKCPSKCCQAPPYSKCPDGYGSVGKITKQYSKTGATTLDSSGAYVCSVFKTGGAFAGTSYLVFRTGQGPPCKSVAAITFCRKK